MSDCVDRARDPEVRALAQAYEEAILLTEHLATELGATVDDLVGYLQSHVNPQTGVGVRPRRTRPEEPPRAH